MFIRKNHFFSCTLKIPKNLIKNLENCQIWVVFIEKVLVNKNVNTCSCVCGTDGFGTSEDLCIGNAPIFRTRNIENNLHLVRKTRRKMACIGLVEKVCPSF